MGRQNDECGCVVQHLQDSLAQPAPELSQHQRSMVNRLQVPTRHLIKHTLREHENLNNSQSRPKSWPGKLTCRTTLVSCGTTVTILDPLSTRRKVSSFWLPPEAKAACSPVGLKVIFIRCTATCMNNKSNIRFTNKSLPIITPTEHPRQSWKVHLIRTHY